MSRLVTILGVIAAVAAAVFGLVSVLHPQAAIYVMLVGTAAAAAGKELLDPKALRQFGLTSLRRGLPARGSFTRRRKLKAAVGAFVLFGLLSLPNTARARPVLAALAETGAAIPQHSGG